MEPTQKFSLYEYLTRKDSVFDKYANVKRFVKLDGWSWLTLIENNAYGLVYRSVVAHTGGGEGKSWVEWRTNLERVGKYKLFVHIPRFSAMNIMCKSNLLSQWGHKHIRVCYRKLDMKFQSTLLIAGGFLWVSMRVPPESVLSCYMIREIRIILLLGMR